MKYSDIKVTPLLGNRYKVLEPIKYKDIIVPKGYRTNGADIPRIFWVFYPPNKSDYLPAVIIHDYLCDLEEYEKADEYFLEIMENLGVDSRTSFIFYNSVKIYHKVKYKYFKKEM